MPLSPKLFISCILIVFAFSCQKTVDPIDYVDPIIGTDGHGHTFPGATLPFGMIQLSPSNDFKSWDWCSGYHYSDSIIKTFAHTHVSGAGLAALGDIGIMPTFGMLQLNPGTEKDPDSGYRSRFSHDNESASAGYYSVLLQDYNIDVELTCTQRVGFHKYTFNKRGKGNIIIDPTNNIMEYVFNTGLEIVSDREIRGYKYSNGDGGMRKVYFHALFSKPFIEVGLAINDTIQKGKTKLEAKNTRAFVIYDVEKDDEILVKLALSHVSYEGAKKNLMVEALDINFEEALNNAKNEWRKIMAKIDFKGIFEKDNRIFYTAMYHSFLSPNIISDIDGKYMIDGKEYQSNEAQYSNYSTWDTYRTLHPLFSIIEHKKTAELVNSLASRHTVQKVGLPVWELVGFDNKCMIGISPIAPMAEAILKNIDGINVPDAFDAILAGSNALNKNSPNYDASGHKNYLIYHYVPADYNCSVSKTVENNYYDYCVAQVADKFGKDSLKSVYLQRSIGYRNLYNPDNQYLYPKYSTGKWRKIKKSLWHDYIANYVSGNLWGYSSYVPHDVEGLINQIGGKQAFSDWLDRIFADTTSIGGELHVDLSGFIGKYGHGDEPSHHLPFLYNYVGELWKTQEKVRKILTEFYDDTPDGINNNEDFGQMSAWYIMSSLGFYPVSPVDMTYVIGSPNLKEATLNLENNRQFKVKALHISDKNIYVQSISLNGRELNRSFIYHDEIMSGGELIFEMGSKPNKAWASEKENLPISKVEGFEIDSAAIVNKPFDNTELYVFENEHEIKLICNTPNAEIYYTTNGKEPNANANKYAKPIKIKKSMNLKAIAFKEGLLPSLIYDQNYLKAKQIYTDENFPLLMHNNISSETDPDKLTRLFDRKIGSKHFGDGNWFRMEEQEISFVVDFGKATTFNSVTVGFLINTGVWIFPPEQISVSISNDNSSFVEIESINFEEASDASKDPSIIRERLNINGEKSRYLKIKIKNFDNIPGWHKAFGHQSMCYIDEILIY